MLFVLTFSMNFNASCLRVIISSLSTSCDLFLIVILFCRLSRADWRACFSIASMLNLKKDRDKGLLEENKKQRRAKMLDKNIYKDPVKVSKHPAGDY